jgi:hypothetical protein
VHRQRASAAALGTTVLCLLGLLAPTAQGRTVPVRQVERAWREACPHLPRATARVWAEVLQREAKKRHFCPYTGIAIVWNETGASCNARLTYKNGSGFYVGLGQIDAYNSKACRDGGLDAPACQARIAALQDGVYNLQRMAAAITANRRMCRARTGQPALFARWLSSYQGFNNHRRSGRAGVWCNMRKDRHGRWRDVTVPRLTRRVMRYRRHLLRKFR